VLNWNLSLEMSRLCTQRLVTKDEFINVSVEDLMAMSVKIISGN
jgi:hypothetical protein